MKISEIISADKPSLSFEVFPPKTSAAFESVKSATEEIAALHPSFISVTYGAGGGTSEYTADIAKNIKDKYGVTPLAHLSCVSSNHEEIKTRLQKLKEYGIENVLALRGDIPEGMDKSLMEYRYASYPEAHPESETATADIENLKRKADAGCDFLTTQMFFDNNILYNFMYRALKAGIKIPVIAGIMPVTNSKQIKRICSISQTMLPQRFRRIVDRYGDKPEAMKQAGIAFATEQIIDLFANGVNAVHVYSMNKPDVAKKILENLSDILS